MRDDRDLQRDVEHELRWDPDIDSTDIAVTVRNGLVTMAGFVRSYMQTLQAEESVKRMAGVAGVANEIEVRLPEIDQRPDPELARDAIARIRAELPYSWEQLRAVAEDGWLTLEGEVEWNYQRRRAEEAVRVVGGIKGVNNVVAVRPHVAPVEIKRKIEEALRPAAETDSSRITAEAIGREVTLRGAVRSWAERQQAEGGLGGALREQSR